MLRSPISFRRKLFENDMYFIRTGSADNLYNEQDVQSVHYDGTKWIQPGDWGVSEIDLSAYKGRLMLFSAMFKSRRTTQGAAFIV